MSEDKNGAVAPGKENPLNQFKNPFGADYELVIENIFNIPSPHMDPANMLVLQQRIINFSKKRTSSRKISPIGPKVGVLKVATLVV